MVFLFLMNNIVVDSVEVYIEYWPDQRERLTYHVFQPVSVW